MVALKCWKSTDFGTQTHKSFASEYLKKLPNFYFTCFQSRQYRAVPIYVELRTNTVCSKAQKPNDFLISISCSHYRYLYLCVQKSLRWTWWQNRIWEWCASQVNNLMIVFWNWEGLNGIQTSWNIQFNRW